MFGKVKVSGTVMSDSLHFHGLQPVRLLWPWNSPGKSIGVGCHFLLQAMFPTQGLKLSLLHCRQILYCRAINTEAKSEGGGKPCGLCLKYKSLPENSRS